jgi:hypothetical protein
MVVTSPIETTIPEVITGYQEYRFRRDGRAGLQCRTQYPQFLTTDFEWAACIPKNLDPSSPLRFTPTLEQCPIVPCSAIDLELRRLSSYYFKVLNHVAIDAAERAKWFLTNYPQHKLVAETRNTLFQRLRMLGVSNTYEQIVVAVAGLQRTTIDLNAIIDYETIYRTRLRSPDLKDHPIDTKLMGAFTESEEEAQVMSLMGIPFYLIRPAFQITCSPSTLIGKQVAFQQPSPWIVLADFDPPLPTLFQGYPHADMQRAGQQLRLDWVDFLAPSRIITHQAYCDAEPSSGPVRSETPARRDSPCKLLSFSQQFSC